MQILIIHQFFNTPQSGGALRSYYLAKALCQAGHTVHLITTHNKPHYQSADVEGIDVHYLPVTYYNRFGFFKRVYSFLIFVLSIFGHAARFRQVSLCYAISAPLTTGLAAIGLKWRYGIPYVFEVGDLWPEAPIQMGVVRQPWLKKLLYLLETAIYRQARAIVALSEPIAANIRQRFPVIRIEVITNMADTDYFYSNTAAVRHDAHNPLIAAYVGTMGRANGLQFVLDCARACLQQKLPVRFMLCGDGAEKENLKQAARKMKLDNVTFLPFCNLEQVRQLLSAIDVALVCFRALPVLETGAPHKYFDALAAGKAVVVNFGGWIKEEIEQCGCGFYAAQGDDFAEKIIPYIEENATLQRAKHAARQLAGRYARPVLSARFVKLIEQLSGDLN